MTTNELLKRGIGHNCLSDAYELGKADGYHSAETDYFKHTEKDRQDSFNCGYEQGVKEAFTKAIEAIELAKLDNNIRSTDWYFGLDEAAEIIAKLQNKENKNED